MLKLPLNVRPVRLADAPALARLHAEVFPKAWDAKAIAGLLAGAEGLVACAAEGTVVGFLLWQQAAEDADLLTLAVAPSCRRQGIAKALLQALCAALIVRGVQRIFLEVGKDNVPACRLYAAFGFETVGLRRNYYTHKPPAARDAWTLMCQLPAPF
jgi:ribosomal-protein-alanine N-acetyltransferase